jgi:hypothetical protein
MGMAVAIAPGATTVMLMVSLSVWLSDVNPTTATVKFSDNAPAVT